ncbi:hypothetical protein CEXT_594381 [Caerostris extrusa]|uniref:Uncharacterized protein n=1 Tax=Caerostris extrusa TaxID=172846 RepID=A0AAV4UXC3_CAEEX|nr:hypothetical protein CEXT_594381 [Caerostris extrusa]
MNKKKSQVHSFCVRGCATTIPARGGRLEERKIRSREARRKEQEGLNNGAEPRARAPVNNKECLHLCFLGIYCVERASKQPGMSAFVFPWHLLRRKRKLLMPVAENLED